MLGVWPQDEIVGLNIDQEVFSQDRDGVPVDKCWRVGCPNSSPRVEVRGLGRCSQPCDGLSTSAADMGEVLHACLSSGGAVRCVRVARCEPSGDGHGGEEPVQPSGRHESRAQEDRVMWCTC